MCLGLLTKNKTMLYRISGGIFFLLLGVTQCGFSMIPLFVIGIFGIIAGIALLFGGMEVK